MIKYQLERIKDMYSGISDPDRLDGIPVVTVAQSDIEWLIQQAERAQEYDRELISLEDNKHYVSEMLAKNKRYREALEFYADKENYKPFDGIFLSSYQNKVDEDGGDKARKELERLNET